MIVFFRLAAHMPGFKCYQIELTRGYDYSAFREDLKQLYFSAGLEKRHTVFLFTDTQVHLYVLHKHNSLLYRDTTLISIYV